MLWGRREEEILFKNILVNIIFFYIFYLRYEIILI